MSNLSWGASAGTRDKRLLSFSAATAALLAALVFTANAEAQAPATVKVAALARAGRSHDGEAAGQESQAPPSEEAGKESQTPPAEEAAKEDEKPPAEEAPQENKIPPGQETPKEDESPPAEETPGDQGPPGEETLQEQPAPALEETPQQEQHDPPPQQGAEEDRGAPADEPEARGTDPVSEGEQDAAGDTRTPDSEAGEETAHHASGAEEAAQRASASEQGPEASAEAGRESARPGVTVEAPEAPGDQQDTFIESQADQLEVTQADPLDVTSDVVSGAQSASAAEAGAHATAIGEFAEETAARVTGELSCDLAALGQGGGACGPDWPGDGDGLANLAQADVATVISSMMAIQTGSTARTGHGDSSLGSVPVTPAPGSVPSGSSGAAAGASGVAPSPGLTQARILLSGAPRAMHTLRLSFKPWLTTYFVLIPERPG